jgi:ATP-binding cassette subfamily B multidrug efflux pump
MGKLLHYLRPIWWLVLIDVILLGLQSYFALLIPNLMSNITKIMEYPQNYTKDMTALINLWNLNFIVPTGDPLKDTWIIGGFMVAFAFGFLLCAFATSIMTSHVGAFYAKSVRHSLFQKVTSMSVGEYYDFGTASLITRTTNDIEQTQLSIQMGLRIMIMSPVSLIIAIVLIFTNDPKLAGIVACVIPVLIVVAAVLLILATPLFKKLQELMDKLTSVLRESLKGVRVIRAFNQHLGFFIAP